jgi:hypothetical protein
MSPKTTPMHASAAGAQACVVGACAAAPIFSATAIASVHCSPMKHSQNVVGRKPQTASAASFGAAALTFEHGSLSAEPQLRCPLWVKSRHDALKLRCPLYPQKRTLIEPVAMSALCQ